MHIIKSIFYQKQEDLLYQNSAIPNSPKSIQMVTDLQQLSLHQGH